MGLEPFAKAFPLLRVARRVGLKEPPPVGLGQKKPGTSPLLNRAVETEKVIHPLSQGKGLLSVRSVKIDQIDLTSRDQNVS